MAKSAFGSSVARKTVIGSTQATIIPPADLLDPETGKVIFSADDISEAIKSYVEGSSLAAQGKTLMEINSPILTTVARRRYAEMWINKGARPSSPKMLSSTDAQSPYLTAVFMNAQRNLDSNSFSHLAAIIGEDEAKSVVVQRDDFSLNAEKLGMELPQLPLVEVVDENGKPVYTNTDGKTKGFKKGEKIPKGWVPKMRMQTVMDQVDLALSKHFESLASQHKELETLLDGLFVRTPVFKTAKDMLLKLPDLIGAKTPLSSIRLAEAFEAARITIQLKSGQIGKDDDIS